MTAVAVVALAYVALKPASPARSEAASLPRPEKPWLSHAAQDQVIGPGGTLGPLFDGVLLGSAPPAAEIRARIAAFARANDVDIDFEIADGTLVAIRFDVTFGGCCGYEGAENLAMRIGQPNNGGGCGTPKFYYSDWARIHDDGTHVRATLRVNRLSLRWEQAVSLADVMARAEALLGADRGTISTAAGDRFLELDAGTHYLLELPYTFGYAAWHQARTQPSERGIQITTDRRIVTEASFTTNEDRAGLKARWGRPRVGGDRTWTWHCGDRTITATLADETTTVTLTRR